MRHLLVSTVLLAFSVAGCVAPPDNAPLPPPPAAAPPPPPPAPAPLAGDWRDWPLTPGTWRYERDARGTRASFGSDARLVLRCDLPARRFILSRAGQATGPLTIRTSSTTRALPVRPGGDPTVNVAAEPGARDAILDAMAFSRGRFVIEQAGAPTLVVPAYAEIGRVIEDCRG